MTIDELLNENYSRFSENEKYVCHFLSGHRRTCYTSSIEVFAAECHVSKALLVRFAKKLGLSGYGELKARLRLEARAGEVSTEGLMDKLTESYHKMMDDLMVADLTPVFEKLYVAEHVFVYGSGSSQARAASEMKRMFLPAREMVHIHGHDMCRSLQRIVRPTDLVILISLSGESDSVVQLARALQVNHVPSISITRLSGNTLASLCEKNLYIRSIQMPAEYQPEYEIATPYFILIEFLYLSYQNFIQSMEV